MAAEPRREYSTTTAAPAGPRASQWRAAGILAILVLCAAPVDAVTHRLTSVADLDVVYTDGPFTADWRFEDDLLVVQIPQSTVEIRALRGLTMMAGTVSFRIKTPVPGGMPGVTAGVVFRMGERGAPDGRTGQYVTVSPGQSTLQWTSVAQWDRNFPIARAGPAIGRREAMGGGGKRRPIPGWNGVEDDDWIGVRIEMLPDGAHTVSLDFRRLETVWLDADDMRATNIGALGDKRTPASELIARGDPLFGPGGVGIYVRGTSTAAEVLFADFEIDRTLSVSAAGRITTTWGDLKMGR